MGEPGTHGKYMATRRPLLIKDSKKGGSWQGRGQAVIGGFGDSFLQVINSEAGTRMSWHDQTDVIS